MVGGSLNLASAGYALPYGSATPAGPVELSVLSLPVSGSEGFVDYCLELIEESARTVGRASRHAVSGK